MPTPTPDRARWIRGLARSWRWIVGAALLAALVGVAGPGELAALALRASPGWVLGVVVLTAAWLLLGALNVWILLRRLADVPFTTFLPAYLHGWAASLLLPGQLGDATQVLLLRRHGVATGQSGAAYLLDKAVSLLWILLVTLYGAALYLPDLHPAWLLALPAAGLAAVGLAAAILWHAELREGSLPARVRDLLGRLVNELRAFRRHPATMAFNVAMTLVKWIVLSAMYWGTFRAFGSEIGVEASATIPMMSSLVGYLPVSISGLGTVEWTAVALFRRVGIETAAVLSVYLFFRAVLLVMALGALVTLRRAR